MLGGLALGGWDVVETVSNRVTHPRVADIMAEQPGRGQGRRRRHLMPQKKYQVCQEDACSCRNRPFYGSYWLRA